MAERTLKDIVSTYGSTHDTTWVLMIRAGDQYGNIGPFDAGYQALVDRAPQRVKRLVTEAVDIYLADVLEPIRRIQNQNTDSIDVEYWRSGLSKVMKQYSLQERDAVEVIVNLVDRGGYRRPDDVLAMQLGLIGRDA